MGKCPCIGCTAPKRTSTCHGSCQPYLDWRDEDGADRRAQSAARNRKAPLDDYLVEKAIKRKKRRH